VQELEVAAAEASGLAAALEAAKEELQVSHLNLSITSLASFLKLRLVVWSSDCSPPCWAMNTHAGAVHQCPPQLHRACGPNDETALTRASMTRIHLPGLSIIVITHLQPRPSPTFSPLSSCDRSPILSLSRACAGRSRCGRQQRR
jgi:hypothetical protein